VGVCPVLGGVSVYGDIPLSWAPQIFLEEFDSSATSTKAGTGQSDRWRHVPAGQGALREPDDYGHARDRGGGWFEWALIVKRRVFVIPRNVRGHA
jgi:hypothetical protein